MRKLVAATLAGALSLGAVSPAFADGRDNQKKGDHKSRFESQFKDWKGDFWGNEALARMVTLGVIKGNDDGTVAASRSVSRLEAAIMLTRLLDLKLPELPEGEFEIKAPWGKIEIENKGREFELKIKTKDGEFKIEDSKNIPAWGRAAILAGLEHGFLLFDGAKVSPMASLNRLEAAIMLVKANGLDAEAQAKAGATLEFKDADKIASRLRGYVAIAVEKGFVTGYEDGTFQPSKLVSRAEWATLLDRLDRKESPTVSKDGRQLKATITAVGIGSSPSIMVTTPVFPGGVTYSVDDTAVFYEKGKEITIADLSAGDNVIINLSPDRQVLMVTVNNAQVQVTGTVKAYTAPTSTADGSIKLTVDGTDKTFPVAKTAAVTLGDKAATLAEIRIGDQVKLTTEGAQVTKIAIKVEAITVTGTLSAITRGSNSSLPTLTVTGANNTSVTYTVVDHATLADKAGKAITMDDLEVGDQVSLRVERNMVVRIVETADFSAPVQVVGTVKAYTAPTSTRDGSIKLTVGTTEKSFSVSREADLTLGGDDATFADVRIGDRVEVTAEGTAVTAIAIKVETVTVTGTLSGLTAGSNSNLPTLTVTGTNNSSKTYVVADHATLAEANGDALTMEDLQVGDELSLRVQRNMVIRVVRTEAAEADPEELEGTVVAVTAPTATGGAYSYGILVGSTLEVYTTTADTAIRYNGSAIAAGRVGVGDQVTFAHEGHVLTSLTITDRAE